MNTLEQQLTNAMNLLTKDNWNKFVYFCINNKQLCMCAHGAVIAEGNDIIKRTIGKKIYGVRMSAECQHESNSSRAIEVSATANHETTGRWDDFFDHRVKNRVKSNILDSFTDDRLKEIWNNRNKVILSDGRILENKDDPHYLLGMVGLTSKFNDTVKDLSFIKDKFIEAIELARRLGV